jgi:hypothetical protein
MKIKLPHDVNELQNKASSPKTPADNEYAAFAAQLAARSERLRAETSSHRPDFAAPPVDPKGPAKASALAAQLAARTERFSAGLASTPPTIDPAGLPRRRVASLPVAMRASHIAAGASLLIVSAVAVWLVWGPLFQSSQALPPNNAEQAKAAVPDVDRRPENSPPPADPPPAPQELDKATPDLPPQLLTSRTPLETQPDMAPLTTAEVRELQSLLKAVGFSPGTIDGIVGPATLGAVRKYGDSRTIPNAEATRELLSRLRTEARPNR